MSRMTFLTLTSPAFSADQFESIAGSKKALDPVTILLYANMSDTEKKKVPVFGNSAKPSCFMGIALAPYLSLLK